jgi:1-deoxy-D-xylulose-5-phosphate reductoisomerase
MGQKITIDSASMMNKGLEVIKPHICLLTPDEIDVLHPQSIIHGMVNFRIVPLSRSWGRPTCAHRSRIASAGPIALSVGSQLDLARLDNRRSRHRFRAFPGAPACLNVKDRRGATTYTMRQRRAVAVFIAGKIKFGAIARLVEATLEDWIRSGNSHH